MSVPEFKYQKPFPLGKDHTDYYLLSKDYVSTTQFEGREILKVQPEALRLLARTAMRDCSFLLRPAHQAQVAAILDDPQASENDKYVALTMLRNAEVSAKVYCLLSGYRYCYGGSQKRPGSLDGRRRRRGTFARSLRYLYPRKPALFTNHSPGHVPRKEFRMQFAGSNRHSVSRWQ